MRRASHGARRRGAACAAGVVILAVLVAAGCGAGGDAGDVQDGELTGFAVDTGLAPLEEPVTVQIAEDGSPSGAGFYLADERGYFSDLGIDVEFVTFASSGSMLPAIASDQVQVAGGIMTASLFNAVDRGLDLRIIGDKGRNWPDASYFDFVVGADHVDDIRNYEDLRGKKIAIAGRGSIDEMYVDWLLEAGGLTVDDVEYVIIEDFSQMNAALANGAVETAMHIEPSITQGETQGILDRWHDATEWAPDTQVAVVLASPDFVDNEDLGRRFMVAYLQGLREYLDAFGEGTDLDSVIETMTSYTPMTDADLWREVNVTYFSPDAGVNVDSLNDQLQWFHERDYYDGDASIESVVDMSLQEFAVETLDSRDDD